MLKDGSLDLIHFDFDKPFFRTSSLLDKFELSLSTLKRYKSDWVSKGGDLKDMGLIVINGYREECWDPQKFLSWLLEHKVSTPKTYDYEVKEEKKLKTTIFKLNSNKGAKHYA